MSTHIIKWCKFESPSGFKFCKMQN